MKPIKAPGDCEHPTTLLHIADVRLQGRGSMTSEVLLVCKRCGGVAIHETERIDADVDLSPLRGDPS